ncbi:MAG: glycosyltransferase [Oceanospirillaceae bacterium]|nr:glycosyltransferase [Colwellia sp.]NQZ32161.1 glycosyltransferase [Oceanospirillaceae bacterium]
MVTIKRISFILPTIGRKEELVAFLVSLKESTGIQGIVLEVIIVDQNSLEFDLYSAVSPFSCFFELVYIHSVIKGLSYNRNVGLKVATGDVFSFPDDDCLYFEDTISSIVLFFKSNSKNDVVLGRIFDRENSSNIIKSWPSKGRKVSALNVYFLASSITIFMRPVCAIEFDENLGAGAKYGSCEDPDYLYRIIDAGFNVYYTPQIDVWHPVPDMTVIELSKVQSYAAGFGYFVRKQTTVVKVILFILLIIKKVAESILYRKRFRRGYFKVYFKGLFMGFMFNKPVDTDDKK